nr:hypothetical protein [Tanacetum cinerariifolium]
DDDLEDDQEDDGDDRDTFDMWDITVEDIKRIRKFLTPNVLEGYNNEETKFKVTLISNYMVDAHGVVLGSFFETGRHFKFELVRHHAKDD